MNKEFFININFDWERIDGLILFIGIFEYWK